MVLLLLLLLLLLQHSPCRPEHKACRTVQGKQRQ
jgi:hypothetical protein